MRILYILITFICLALSIVFLFSSFSYKSGKTESANEMLIKQQELATEEQSKIDELQKTLDSKKAEKETLEAQSHYITDPVAFLTFNSVPSSNTGAILDILKEKGIKATFYVTGSLIQTDEDRDVIKRIVDEGHAIGIRAYDSTSMQNLFSSADNYIADVKKCASMIKEITGTDTKIVRMPGGTEKAKEYCDTYGNGLETMKEIMTKLEEEGFSVCDWYVDAEYDNQSAPVEYVTTSAKVRIENTNYKAYIVLLYGSDTSLQILPEIIDSLKEVGYNTFETIVPNGYSYIKYDVQ